jgi:hypothetical protein
VSHVRTQLRDAIKAVLDANLGSGYVVYAGRRYAKNVDTKALVDMQFQNENIEALTMGGLRQRTASLYIRCQRAAKDAVIDDLLDADEVAIGMAIQNQDWNAYLMEQPQLVQVNWVEDSTGGSVVAGIVLRYDLEYRVTTTDFANARD